MSTTTLAATRAERLTAGWKPDALPEPGTRVTVPVTTGPDLHVEEWIGTVVADQAADYVGSVHVAVRFDNGQTLYTRFAVPVTPAPKPGAHRAAGRPSILPRGPLVTVSETNGTRHLSAYLGGEHKAGAEPTEVFDPRDGLPLYRTGDPRRAARIARLDRALDHAAAGQGW